MLIKQCSKCKETKPHTEFCRDKKTKDGLHGHCKACRRKYNKKYHLENRERRKEYNRKRYQENRACYREYDRKYYLRNRERVPPLGSCGPELKDAILKSVKGATEQDVIAANGIIATLSKGLEGKGLSSL